MDNATAQIVSTTIFMLGIIPCIAFGVHLARIWAQRLPEHMRLVLEQFARQSVRQVEQEHRSQSNSAKKALAQASLAKLFKAHNLPMPSQESIDIALEAAVFELPQTNAPPAMNG